jgi:hypothetical protein
VARADAARQQLRLAKAQLKMARKAAKATRKAAKLARKQAAAAKLQLQASRERRVRRADARVPTKSAPRTRAARIARIHPAAAVARAVIRRLNAAARNAKPPAEN